MKIDLLILNNLEIVIKAHSKGLKFLECLFLYFQVSSGFRQSDLRICETNGLPLTVYRSGLLVQSPLFGIPILALSTISLGYLRCLVSMDKRQSFNVAPSIALGILNAFVHFPVHLLIHILTYYDYVSSFLCHLKVQ